MLVTIDAEVARRNASRGADRCRFGYHEARAADGAAAEMNDMPVIRKAVDARVFAHGRNHDAIAQLDAADGIRVEEMGHAFENNPVAERLRRFGPARRPYVVGAGCGAWAPSLRPRACCSCIAAAKRVR